jgi:hypothetical protein
MNIPPKYEDVVAHLDAALAREAALREDLARYKFLFGQAQKAIDRLDDLHPKRMDYPLECMPEQGRDSMRENAKAIVDAAMLNEVKT